MIRQRIIRVWQARVGAQLTELEAQHAEAMLDQERERFRGRVVPLKRDLAAGWVRVARGCLYETDRAADAEDQAALDDDALARFEARRDEPRGPEVVP